MTESARTPRPSIYAIPAASALGSAGAALVLAGLIDLTDGGHDMLPLGLVGLVSLGSSVLLRRLFTQPDRYRAVQSLTALVVVWLTLIAVGALALSLTGAFADLEGTQRWSGALFESTSGFTTTGMTALPVVEDAGRGVLFFRAASNWLGGLAALISVVAVLPFVTRTRDLGVRDRSREIGRSVAPTIETGTRNIIRVYSGFTVVLIIAFAITGIGLFDSVAYALAVVSTGGFAPHSASLWSEGSAAAEWVAILGMFAAGTNVAIIWWIFRGSVGSIWRSMELRVYGAVALGSIIAVSIGIGGPDELRFSREAVFAVASTISTTGLVAFDWWSWGPGAQVLLVLIFAIGAMSGSASGGFRIRRVMLLIEVSRRELVRLVYPRAVHVVKLGGRPIDDNTVRSVAGYLVLYIGVIIGGAYGVGLFEDGVRRILVASVSAASTTGLLLGVRAAHELNEATRLFLLPLMLAGRLAIVPVFTSVERLAASTAALGRRAAGRVRA